MLPTPTPKHRKLLWPVLGGVAVLLILCGAGAIFLYTKARSTIDATMDPTPSAGTSATTEQPRTVSPSRPASTGIPCQFRPEQPGAANPRAVSTPAPRATLTGKVTATLQTNLGPIGVRLDADLAPCTVHSFVHLAREDYYSDTPCHRLTTAGLYVLQCGDPSGTGTGTPGYQFGEENLPTSTIPYPRGILAMANAGPGTNGGQFFVVYRDSDIPPDYTVFGSVASGLDIVDRVATAGTTEGGADGSPKLAIRLDELTIG